jgi:catechol 2,3-dioxygenase
MNQLLDPRVRIGHIHLKVADLERSVKFYTEILGFEVTSRIGKSAAFLSAGGYHHHIGLNTWESEGGSPPPPGSTGLYHFAILVPDRMEFARIFRRLNEHGWQIEGAADHGVSEAIYFKDPDSNGIEIYADKPKNLWPRGPNGAPMMYTRPLDLDSLIAELTVDKKTNLS